MSNNAHMPVALRFPDNVVVVALREIVEKLTRRMKVNETIQSSAQDSDN
jgi:DNA-directed RNA polymerase subunit K/omega